MKRNMTTPSLAISIGRSRSRLALLLIPLVFACFALSPDGRAVSPPPDGGYPNNNTAEGSDALFSLTTGTDNTAIGFDALYSNTGGGASSATRTRRLVLRRSLATQSAATTRPSVFKRSLTTQPASTTRPTVLMRSIATQPAATTRPTVIMRSKQHNRQQQHGQWFRSTR